MFFVFKSGNWYICTGSQTFLIMEKKGILERFKDIDPVTLKLDDKFWKEFENFWFESEKIQQKNRIEKQKRIKDNFKELEKKSKELGKPIPDGLLVIIYLDQPVGSWFFEEYKEWLND